MLCIDNSEYSRNGDYAPSRFDAQNEVANLLAGTKTGQNPETGVGLLTMGGERVEVHQTPSTDHGSFVAALAQMQIKGKSDVIRGIQCATLALKHRQNKNQKQKIICFVGSPLATTVTEKQVEQLGKQLKKNNVSLDIVSFGEIEENKARLEKLISSCNSNDNSHLVIVDPEKNLSDSVVSSAICFGEGGAPPPNAGGGDNFEFGVDGNTDPELALALRISMEEERRRQEGANGGAPAEGAAAATDTNAAAGGPSVPAPATGGAGGASAAAADFGEGFEDMDEELRMAIQMSMQDTVPQIQEPDAKKQKTEPKDAAPANADASALDDPAFLQDLLGSLPGVDINDASIQQTIHNAEKKKDDDKKDGDKKNDKDKDKK